MNLSSLREEVRDNVNNQSSVVLSDTKIDRYVNWAQRRLAEVETFDEMQLTYQTSTVDGQEQYSFPERMKCCHSLKLLDGANSRKLVEVMPRQMDVKIPYPAQYSEGRPKWYVHWGDYFECYRIPDDAYTLELRASMYPPLLTCDSGTPLLKDKDELVVALATSICWAGLDGIEESQWWSARARYIFEGVVSGDDKAPDLQISGRGFATGEGVGYDETNPFTWR